MLPAYFDCARRAAAKQFGDEIKAAGFDLRETSPTAGAALGTAVHAAAEHMLREKIASGRMGSVSDATELAVSQFKEETDAGAEWDDTTPNLKTAHFQIGRLAQEYADFAATLNPKAVELSLRADAGDGFELTGHIDVLEWSASVRDLKTGALERPYQSQLGAYSLLVKSSGEAVNEVVIDWLPRAPKTTVQPPVESKFFNVATCERAAWATIQIIKRDLQQFRTSSDPWSFPANPMTMMCGARFCPAHGTAFCDMHSQPKTKGLK